MEDRIEEVLVGEIVKITYQNDDNGYTVAVLSQNNNLTTVVGIMPDIRKGDEVEITGTYIVHPNYGRQFKVVSALKTIPTTVAGILKYLSSGAISGVGPSTARKIVKRFGEETMEILKTHPEYLAQIEGISETKAASIGEQFSRQNGIRDIMVMLGDFKISPEESLKIYQKLGQDSLDIIRDNPYALCGIDIGFSFERADEIGERFNIDLKDKNRLKAGIIYILVKNLSNGHTCLPFDKLISVAAEYLNCEKDIISDILEEMIISLKVLSKDVEGVRYIALSEYYNAEDYISSRLIALDNFDAQKTVLEEKEIALAEDLMNIRLESQQAAAVKAVFQNGITVLTGSPGTGKTTTLKVIIALLKQKKYKVMLAAPTGRAAKRMTELTGEKAKTIHRLLEVDFTENEKPVFSKNETDPLDCDALIVDEMSMVDTALFASLLKAIRLGTKLVLVGDMNQLPSISAGNILSDIIASECFNCVMLYKIFRQASESAIIRVAHALISNYEIDLSEKQNDFFFLSKNDALYALKLIKELCSTRLNNAYGYDSLTDIQVLCPMKKTELGTVNINNVLQETLNPKQENAPQLFYKGFYLREKDKVMQVKNNYDIAWKKDDGEQGSGIYNGDVGYIEKITLSTGIILIRFDDRVAEYTLEDLKDIELGYAVTVHKSQGSEFECVILQLIDVPKNLKYRNLLYTAVTRAKKTLIVIGKEETFRAMALNDRKTLRYTLLKAFLEEKVC